MSLLRITGLLVFIFPLLLKAQPGDSIKSFRIDMKEISFKAPDGIEIKADAYTHRSKEDSLPWMLLCHQAGYSRGEYAQTAYRFAKLGYNCLAIDQRSGDSVNDVRNQTNANALAAGKKTSYLDAEQDIMAALDYLYKKSGKKVVLVGSSYSASLVLKIAAGNDKVRAVMAFSPGEYFGSKLDLKKSITSVSCPVFITSSKTESKDAGAIAAVITSSVKVHYIPSGVGRHGSSALWNDCKNRNEYWLAIIAFTEKI